MIRTRTKDALGALKAKGRLASHETPIGWKIRRADGKLVACGEAGGEAILVEDPHEQAAIGRMLELHDEGKSSWVMANTVLPREGFPPRGSRWWRSTCGRVVREVRRDPVAVARAMEALKQHRLREAARSLDRLRDPTPEDKRAAALQTIHKENRP